MENLLRMSVIASIVCAPVSSHAAELTVTAVNRLNLTRPSQTVELTAKQLEPLGVKELDTVRVEGATGKTVAAK